MTDTSRRRLSAEDRRRQLLGIGLAKLMEKPIQDLSMDEIAAEAGISRGLLFHYFPTKTDYYHACVAAAGRRILRNTAPDESDAPKDQLRSMVRLSIEQVERRRAFYLSMIHGSPDIAESVREVTTDRVMKALAVSPDRRPLVHAWWAYVEDHALSWSGSEPRAPIDDLVGHCCSALTALLELP